MPIQGPVVSKPAVETDVWVITNISIDTNPQTSVCSARAVFTPCATVDGQKVMIGEKAIVIEIPNYMEKAIANLQVDPNDHRIEQLNALLTELWQEAFNEKVNPQ